MAATTCLTLFLVSCKGLLVCATANIALAIRQSKTRSFFFLLIIQCKAMHGARIKNASTIRTVEKKDNIKFPKSASFTLNILSIQDISQVFQKAMEVIK